MRLSRRTLFRQIGAGAAAGVGLPSLTRASLSAHLSDPVSSGARAGDSVRLHLNENAYGPSAKAIAAIRDGAASLAGRYPDAQEEGLRNKLAGLHRVMPEQVIVGCGSGEILRMAALAFSRSGKKVILAHPTFELMAECARRAGAQVVSVALRSDYSHDLDSMLSHADAATGLVYICNPNNPTGSLTRRQDLEAFLRKLPLSAYVLMDEAYHHYVGGSPEYSSFIDRPVDDPRVVVARTFSTIHGLAGVRIGYAIAAPETARLLAAERLRDDVSGVATAAASVALDDLEHVQTSARRNQDDRQEFCNQANARMLRTIDSHTNFVMLHVSRPAVETVEHFRKNGVLVAGPFPVFDKYIRVSLGTRADMREFWRVWDLLPVHHGMTM